MRQRKRWRWAVAILQVSLRCLVKVITDECLPDPRTVAWLEENVDLVFGFPNIARFSWATVKNLLEKKAARVDW